MKGERNNQFVRTHCLAVAPNDVIGVRRRSLNQDCFLAIFQRMWKSDGRADHVYFCILFSKTRGLFCFWSEIKWWESFDGTEGLSLGGSEARGLEAGDNALSLIPPPVDSTSWSILRHGASVINLQRFLAGWRLLDGLRRSDFPAAAIQTSNLWLSSLGNGAAAESAVQRAGRGG